MPGGQRRAKPLTRWNGVSRTTGWVFTPSNKRKLNPTKCDVNPYDNDHFVSTSQAPGTDQLLAREALGTSPRPLEFLQSLPSVQTRELRGKVNDPRSPSLDETVTPGPHASPGVQIEGARSSSQGRGKEGHEPSRAPAPLLRGEPRAGGPCPPAAKPALCSTSPRSGSAAHRTSGGSDRPSSPGCRCPPRPRCGGSGWSPWCAAGQAGRGTRSAATASSLEHGPEQAPRTLAHGRGSLGLRAPTPGSAGGPTPRRPSAPFAEAHWEMQSTRCRRRQAAAREARLGTTFPKMLLARAL